MNAITQWGDLGCSHSYHRSNYQEAKRLQYFYSSFHSLVPLQASIRAKLVVSAISLLPQSSLVSQSHQKTPCGCLWDATSFQTAAIFDVIGTRWVYALTTASLQATCLQISYEAIKVGPRKTAELLLLLQAALQPTQLLQFILFTPFPKSNPIRTECDTPSGLPHSCRRVERPWAKPLY